LTPRPVADTLFVEAVRLALGLAVVGDAKVFQAQVQGGLRHRLDALDAVAPRRVAMERATKIFLLDQLR